MANYERIQKATSVQPNTPYQIDGRIDTIVLGDDGYTTHYDKLGKRITRGRDQQALDTAAHDGTLWECSLVP